MFKKLLMKVFIRNDLQMLEGFREGQDILQKQNLKFD